MHTLFIIAFNLFLNKDSSVKYLFIIDIQLAILNTSAGIPVNSAKRQNKALFLKVNCSTPHLHSSLPPMS